MDARSVAGTTVGGYVEADRSVLAAVLEPLESKPRGRDLPAWLAAVQPLPERSGAAAPPPLDPLFAPRWARGIVTVAVATRNDQDGAVDVAAAVERVAKGRPIRELPRLPWPTNRFGAQVLLDMGEGMLPFRGDQWQLQSSIVRLVGRDRVTVLRFAGCPSRGTGPRSRATWRDYEPPRRGRPVVLVSDLGIAATASADAAGPKEWVEFAELVRRAGCPLVAFVPYPAGRVPSAIRRALAVVPWDRATSVRVVRQVIGRALRAP